MIAVISLWGRFFFIEFSLRGIIVLQREEGLGEVAASPGLSKNMLVFNASSTDLCVRQKGEVGG